MCPIIFRIGHFTFHTYGLMMALGFIAGFLLARKTFAWQDLPRERLDEAAFLCLLTGLLGARILYFGVDAFRPLWADPLSFFRIWEGGLVFYGGFLAALVAMIFFSRRHHIPFFVLSDALAGPLLLAHAFGRLGCFSAGCCYGRASNLPWAVTFTNPESLAPLNTRLHPTQLYESLGDLALLSVYLILVRRRPRAGTLTAFYLMGYGALRFGVEFLRGDDRGIVLGRLEPSQWISLAAILAGLGLFSYANQKKDSER